MGSGCIASVRTPCGSGGVRFAGKSMTDGVPHANRRVRLLIGVDPDDLSRRVQGFSPFWKDRELERQARVADSSDPNTDIKLLVKAKRDLVLDVAANSMEVVARRLSILVLIVPDGAEVLRDGRVKIGKVVPVEDDGLRVDFGVPDSE